MRILLDTNILILRENNHIVPENLAQMMNLINGLENSSIWVHPLSIAEIQKDKNTERQSINISKIKGYAILDTYPDFAINTDFKTLLPPILQTENDMVDNQLLYCVFKNVVDYLITEDQGILNKAEKLGLEQVLNINEAIALFQKFYTNSDINLLQTFKKKKGYEINLEDTIFQTLKQEYAGFANWWNTKVSRRDLFVCEDEHNNKINAILIPKIEENETIDCTPKLHRDKILKICTFKVAEHSRGLKLGERLLKMAFDYAILNNIEEIYLTHYRQELDYLIPLIQNFGFCKYGENSNGEDVYLKRVTIENKKNAINNVDDIININKKYHPSFYDGIHVKKHIVPIKPSFHKKLFPELNNQLSLFAQECSEGYSIKKAYICNSGTRLINEGDILLFYQTQEKKSVTTLGTVEAVYYGLRDAEEIFKLIAKRTVFTFEEVKKCCDSDVTVILFNQNFNLKNEVNFSTMENENIVNGYIQSITNIDNNKYKKIIKGNIDERFIIN